MQEVVQGDLETSKTHLHAPKTRLNVRDASSWAAVVKSCQASQVAGVEAPLMQQLA